jgi:Tfp pilus assembly protein PilO
MAFDQKYLRRYGYFYKNARRYASRREVMISTYLIISLFTVSFFAVVFIRPTAITIAKLWREIQDKKIVHSQLEKKIRDLEKAQSIYSSIEGDLVFLDRALPSTPNYSRFVKEVEYLAFLHGLLLNSAHYDGIELYSSETALDSESILGEYSFTLGLEGSYSQLQPFISDLEKLDRLVTLKSLGFTPLKSPEGSERFVVSLSLDSLTYSFPEGVDLDIE